MAEVGFTVLAPVDAFVHRHRRAVLVVAFVAIACRVRLLPLLRFDFNPLNLKSRTVELMTTLHDTAARSRLDAQRHQCARPVARRRGAAGAAGSAHCRKCRASSRSTSFVPERPAGEAGAHRRCRATPRAVLDVRARRAAIGRRAAARAWRRRRRRCGRRRQQPRKRRPPTRRAVWPMRWTVCAGGHAGGARGGRGGRGRRRSRSCSIRSGRCCRPARSRSRACRAELVADWMAKDGRARIAGPAAHRPRQTRHRCGGLRQAVQTVAPDATGAPISTCALGRHRRRRVPAGWRRTPSWPSR